MKLVVLLLTITDLVLGGTRFKVMTWKLGNAFSKSPNRIAKAAKLIKQYAPNIVGLQGVNDKDLQQILYKLGDWHAFTGGPYKAPIVTRHYKVQNDVRDQFGDRVKFGGVGGRVPLANGRSVRLINLSLNSSAYGPYTLCRSPPRNWRKAATNAELQRLLTVGEALISDLNVKADAARQPVIMVGTFNAPSHLDWTSVAHCGKKFAWPVSKMLADEGFVDSFRQHRPNVSKYPGNTYSTFYRKNKEPQDRIDFIYYRGDQLRVLSSKEVSLNFKADTISRNPIKDSQHPSANKAVLTEFEWV